MAKHRIITISLYETVIEEIDSQVHELKRRGYTRASRSWLIRRALEQFNATELPHPSEFDGRPNR